MMGARRLGDLEAECLRLGLTVTPVKAKVRKEDCIQALRGHYLKEKYPNGVPVHLQLMLSMETPMLCFRFTDLKKEEQDDVWNSPKWFHAEKLDGERCVVIYVKGEGFHFYSRGISVTDFLPIEHDNILFQATDEETGKYYDQFILDTEILCANPHVNTIMGSRGVVTETQLQGVQALLSLGREESLAIQAREAPLYFKAFHLLNCNGWKLSVPYHQMRKDIQPVLACLQAQGMDISWPADFCDPSQKKELYDFIIGDGGEGVVAKHQDSQYHATNSRFHRAWIKIKRSAKESLQRAGLGDTIDAFVTGWEPGDKDTKLEHEIGKLQVSVNLSMIGGQVKEHMIAVVSNLTDELREWFTERKPDGSGVLREDRKGTVCEIDGQAFSSRSKRLRHAVLKRIRDDKSALDCTLDEEWINSQVL
jgi:ATP-dependent DNA ligase